MYSVVRSACLSGVERSLTITTLLFVVGSVMALYITNRRMVINELQELSENLAELASHDQLTDLHNRRPFVGTLEHELSRRDPRPLAFVLFDIDRFKAYNDHYGHPQGDALLQRLAEATRGVFARSDDYVFRLGGEEFGVVFRVNDESQAATLADRLLEAIESLGEPAPTGPRDHVTVSADLTVLRTPSRLRVEALYRMTDRALYRAKHEGRAHWVLAESDENASEVHANP